MKELKRILPVTRVNDTEVIELVTLSEFVNGMRINGYEWNDIGEYSVDYAYFITQPLTKGMFVPCDEEGNVLELPSVICSDGAPCVNGCNECPATPDFQSQEWRNYQQAKERVLFEGCNMNPDNSILFMGTRILWNKTNETNNGFYWGTIEQAINAGVKLLMKVK